MNDYFIFAGYDTRTLGVKIFPTETMSAPKRAYRTTTIPGRNGSMLIDEKRHVDVSHSYSAVIYENFDNRLAQIRSVLMSVQGYQRLEDSINPDEFYMACYEDSFSATSYTDKSMGHFGIEFTRKPQRFLKSGETVTTLTVNGSITNPTLFPSKPLLRVYGTGRVGIGNNSILITDANEYTDIDCDIMEAFKGTTSCNSYVQIQNNDFPVLKPGTNGITLGTGITRVDITPRWYRL